MRKLIFSVIALAAVGSAWLFAPAAGADCWTPRVAGFNTVQVCVADDDILK